MLVGNAQALTTARSAVGGVAHGDTAQGGQPAWRSSQPIRLHTDANRGGGVVLVVMNSDCVLGHGSDADRAVLTAHTAFDPRPMEWRRPDPGVHTTRSERRAPME
eukprot:361481-Chlamydomonas_euryale.AAC.2